MGPSQPERTLSVLAVTPTKEGARRGGGERREEDTTKEDVSDGGRRKERRTISIFFQGLEV